MNLPLNDRKAACISGRTELFCIVADPIAHVRTPQMFNEHLRRIGADAVLVPCHVYPQTLSDVVHGLRRIENLRAIIITVPHKIEMVDLCDELHSSAAMAGAVNVVRVDAGGLLVGANFDGVGFLRSLEHSVGPIEGKSVYMAGAGGVARAIAFSLAGAGISRLGVYNRSVERANGLLQAVQGSFPGIDGSVEGTAPEDYDIAINATSLGLGASDPMPFRIDRLPISTCVADVVMQPEMTSLLEAAEARGMRIVKGSGMLEFQLGLWVEFIEARADRGKLPSYVAAREAAAAPNPSLELGPTC